MSMRNGRHRGAGEGRRPGEGAGRLVQVLLALYLTPALLVVLLVSGVAMLVLGAARAIRSLVHGTEAWPSNPVGPESSRFP